MFRTKSRKACLKRFVRYTKSTDHGTYKSEEMLNGLRATRKNYIHESHGYNRWAVQATPVPDGYLEDKTWEPSWALEYQCRDANKKPKGLDIEHWTNKAKSKWLTISDLKQLKPGDTIDLLPLDRNVGDTVDSAGIPPNKLQAAAKFFEPNKAIYEHKEGLQGKLTLLVNSERIVLDPFEFHVEINRSDNWYPLQDGSLPAKDPQGFVKLLGKKMHWTALDPTTHVGYRGPMIAWSALKKSPKVFWYKK
jgi:hypothetical protein